LPQVHGGDTLVEVFPAERRELAAEASPEDAGIFDSIRFLSFPSTFVARLHDCRLYGRGIAVIGADGRVIEEGSVHIGGHARDHAVMGRAWLPRATFLPGTTAVLSAPAGNTYYHWLFDVLPRIRLLQLAGVDLASIDRFAVNGTTRGFQRETLARFGIGEGRIVETDRHRHLRCERMILPSYPGTSGVPPRWACEFLREAFLEEDPAATARGPSRIYVSRQRSRTRRVENQDELDRLLAKEGFETVYPEDHSVAEQARLFRGARRIVAPHGSGLANLVFCEPGAHLVEIFPPDKVSESHYFVLSQQTGTRHTALVGQRGHRSNFRVGVKS
jgi:capsular polysaccharide biosynthesis protein